MHRFYVEQFKKQGFRVLDVPFHPMGTFLNYYDFSEETKDAVRKVKEEFPKYDVAIMNMNSMVFVDLIHPDLAKEFLSA